jgi:aconitate hydratase
MFGQEMVCMALDIEMIKKVYENFPSKVEQARKTLGRPLTLAEKILYAHLDAGMELKDYPRGKFLCRF